MNKKQLFEERLLAEKKWEEVLNDQNRPLDQFKISTYANRLHKIDKQLLALNLFQEFENYKSTLRKKS